METKSGIEINCRAHEMKKVGFCAYCFLTMCITCVIDYTTCDASPDHKHAIVRDMSSSQGKSDMQKAMGRAQMMLKNKRQQVGRLQDVGEDDRLIEIIDAIEKERKNENEMRDKRATELTKKAIKWIQIRKDHLRNNRESSWKQADEGKHILEKTEGIASEQGGASALQATIGVLLQLHKSTSLPVSDETPPPPKFVKTVSPSDIPDTLIGTLQIDVGLPSDLPPRRIYTSKEQRIRKQRSRAADKRNSQYSILEEKQGLIQRAQSLPAVTLPAVTPASENSDDLSFPEYSDDTDTGLLRPSTKKSKSKERVAGVRPNTLQAGHILHVRPPSVPTPSPTSPSNLLQAEKLREDAVAYARPNTIQPGHILRARPPSVPTPSPTSPSNLLQAEQMQGDAIADVRPNTLQAGHIRRVRPLSVPTPSPTSPSKIGGKTTAAHQSDDPETSNNRSHFQSRKKRHDVEPDRWSYHEAVEDFRRDDVVQGLSSAANNVRKHSSGKVRPQSNADQDSSPGMLKQQGSMGTANHGFMQESSDSALPLQADWRGEHQPLLQTPFMGSVGALSRCSHTSADTPSPRSDMNDSDVSSTRGSLNIGSRSTSPSSSTSTLKSSIKETSRYMSQNSILEEEMDINANLHRKNREKTGVTTAIDFRNSCPSLPQTHQLSLQPVKPQVVGNSYSANQINQMSSMQGQSSVRQGTISPGSNDVFFPDVPSTIKSNGKVLRNKTTLEPQHCFPSSSGKVPLHQRHSLEPTHSIRPASPTQQTSPSPSYTSSSEASSAELSAAASGSRSPSRGKPVECTTDMHSFQRGAETFNRASVRNRINSARDVFEDETTLNKAPPSSHGQSTHSVLPRIRLPPTEAGESRSIPAAMDCCWVRKGQNTFILEAAGTYGLYLTKFHRGMSENRRQVGSTAMGVCINSNGSEAYCTTGSNTIIKYSMHVHTSTGELALSEVDRISVKDAENLLGVAFIKRRGQRLLATVDEKHPGIFLLNADTGSIIKRVPSENAFKKQVKNVFGGGLKSHTQLMGPRCISYRLQDSNRSDEVDIFVLDVVGSGESKEGALVKVNFNLSRGSSKMVWRKPLPYLMADTVSCVGDRVYMATRSTGAPLVNQFIVVAADDGDILPKECIQCPGIGRLVSEGKGGSLQLITYGGKATHHKAAATGNEAIEEWI